MADIGLPSINIVFMQKAIDFRRRSVKGICALILKDDTVEGNSFVYNSMEDVKENWSADNKLYLELIFKGRPSKVYVERVGTLAPTLDTALTKLSNRRWHYLAVPQGETLDNNKLITWIKTKRNTDHLPYKFVGGGLSAPDEKGIINFDTDKVTVDSREYTKQEYTSRICGVLAGMPVDRAATCYELPEIESFLELEDNNAKNAAIAAGKLILTNDGEKTMIARGVNSKTTITESEGDMFKKIRIVETIDRMYEDIVDVIKNYYQGKKVNTYDNKLILCGDITSYLKELVRQNILSPDSDAVCEINFEAQKNYLLNVGIDIEKLSDEQILRANTGDNVFLRIKSEATDVMEDFDLNIYV